MAHPIPYDAVIFDLDGTLAYTEPVIFSIHQALIRRLYGVTLTHTDFLAMLGLGYTDSAAYLIRAHEFPTTTPELETRLLQAVLDQIEGMVKPGPGALELIHALREAGVRLGLASNSPSVYVRLVLRGLGLTAVFPNPVCREDVLHGKPAPDPYLAACRQLEVAPQRSLALEDSPVGLQSALSAGLDCFHTGPMDSITLPLAVPHFDTLDGVLALWREKAT